MLARHLFHRGLARAAVRRAPLAAALAIVAGLNCFGDPSGPRVHPAPTAGFSFVPVFSSTAALVVDFVRVRIVFMRAGTDTVALDTVVVFPSDADSITLNLPIPVQGVGQSENLSFRLALINAAGDTVFRGGPNAVTLTAGSTTTPVLVPIRYTGTGANAAAVRIATRDTSVFFTDSVVLTAVALDSANQPIPGTPIEWTSLDTARALVPLPNSGKVLARAQRGPARIRARLVTGQADTSLVRVQPVPSALALLAGDAQSGTVDATLAQPLTVRVTAVDGLGVGGVKVRFTVVSGGGKVDTMVVTDTAGHAAAQLRLGTVAGPDTVRTTVTGLTGSPVTFVATALPGIAKSLHVTVQPSTTPAGSPIAPAVRVAARDTFGNAATGFAGTVTLAIGTNPASGTLSGTTAVAAVAGVATFGAVSLDRPGTGYTLTATATGLAAANTGAFGVVPGAPTRLNFGVQPGTTVAGAPLAPAARVLILDALGNIATSATDSVTIAFGANPAGGVLAGTLRVAAVAGVADFPSLRIAKAGNGYTLAASATGLTGATSGAFSVTVGAAARLAFTVQPVATIAGVTIAPAPQVMVQDSVGNTVTGSTASITLAITSGTGTTGAVLGGTLTQTAVNGVATFSGLTIDKVGTGYTLTATAPSLTSATSGAFSVTVGAAARLAFTVQPSTVTAGAAIAPAIQVAVQDAQGNTVTGSTASITLAITSGTGTAGAVLGGTLTQTAVNGVATFSNLTIDKVGAGYTLTATAPSLTSATSGAFSATVGAAARLAYKVQPSTVTAGAAIAPAVQVAVQDAQGNPVTTATTSITLAITSGTGTAGAVLGGTLTRAAVAGVADFPSLAIAKAGTGYTITATATGVTGAASTAFDVTVGAATKLAFTVQPITVTAGVAVAPAPQVTVQDSVGNAVTGSTASITLAITSGTGTAGAVLGGTLAMTAVAGVAPFSNLTVDKVGTGYTLTATAPSLTGATSAAFGVTPAAAAAVVFTTQPSAVVAGAAISPAAVVAVRDAFGNVATGYTSAVTLAIGTNPGSATLSGTPTVSAVAGVATFSDLTLDHTGTGYTLTAASGALTGATSTAFDVTAGAPAAIGLTSGNNQMATISTALAAPLIVFVQDALGNGVPGLTVNWDTPVGGGTIPTTSLTDATGHAQATWTLGTLVGTPQNAAAKVAGLAGSPVAFTASATPVGANAWKNPAGGLWSVGSNWSGGVPGSTDNTVIALPGTYTVTLDQTALVGGFSASYGRLDLNGNSLSVTGSFALSNTATLRMANAASALNVTGDASFAGGSTAGLLTAGTLTINGNFAQSGDPASFAASGTHLTLLQPTASSRTVTMASSDTTTGSHFANLSIAPNWSGVTVGLNSNTSVLGNVVLSDNSLNGRLTVSGTGELIVKGGVSLSQLGGGVAVSNSAVRLGGQLTLGSTAANFSPGEVEFFGGNGQVVPAGAAYKAMTITGDSVVFTGVMGTTGDLTIRGNGLAHFNGSTVTVGGGLTTQGAGALRMSADAPPYYPPTLSVTGDVVFGGGSTAGRLSAGTFYFLRNFRQEGNPQSFQPTGVTTWAGTGSGNDPSQVFRFQNPGATLSRFGDFNAYGDVRFASDVYVAGALTNYYTVKDTLGSWTATLAGDLMDYSTPGDARWIVGKTILVSPTTSWPVTTTTNLFVRNSLTATDLTVTGNVTVEDGGVLDPQNGTVTVTGSLATTGTGLVRQSTGSIVVGQDASFAGTSDLTGGSLEIGGNFTQLGTTSFQAAAAHTTSFTNSAAPQTVSFETPDTLSGSHFGNMEMGASDGVVQLLTDAAVQGTFGIAYATNATLRGTGTLLTRGLSQSGFLTIDGTLLVLAGNQPVSVAPYGSSTTFRNQPPAATQFWIRRSDPCLAFNGLVFETVPGPDGHYVGVENLSGGSSQNIYFGSGSPASLEPYVQSIGSPTINYAYGSCGPF